MTFKTVITVTIMLACLALSMIGCDQCTVVTTTDSNNLPDRVAASPSPDRDDPNKCPAEYYGERYEDDPGYTPKYLRCTDLHEKLDNAIIDGDLDRIKYLLSSGANVNGWYSHRFPPLYTAAMRGHKEIAEFLIENGARLDKGDSWGKTPLMAAVFYNHSEVVKLLIEKGADVCISSNGGTGEKQSALDVAVDKGYRDIETLLINAGATNCQK
ncbi:MAG: ankyrin repeat domain-containing protein [Acidobacteria bacterium]|nr:ankyrin repeat domain-containing protein [Acidobacteriota bacterium]